MTNLTGTGLDQTFSTLMEQVLTPQTTTTPPTTPLTTNNQENNDTLTVLVVGDNHWKRNNLSYMKEFAAKFINVINERKPDIIVNLGDTLDRHASIDMEPNTEAQEFLLELTKLVPTYLLIGNHDRKNNSDFLTNYHPFTGLKYCPNITIADQVVTDIVKGYRLCFVPYVPNGRLDEALRTKLTNFDEIDCYFMHQELRDVPMGMVKSVEGDIWSPSRPLAVSGHIHERYVSGNILYPGTPMQVSFSSFDLEHTISLLTFSPKQIEQDRTRLLIKNSPRPNLYIYEETIDLNLTKRIIVKLNCQEIINWTPPQNAIVKVILSGSSTELRTTMKLECVKLLKQKNVTVVPKANNDLDPELKKYANYVHKDLTYLQRLNLAIKEQEELIPLFNKVFGTISG